MSCDASSRSRRATRNRAATALLFAALAFSGCARPVDVGEPRIGECVPHFPDGEGWLGGDGGFSIPLTSEVDPPTLWLFGDSFISRPNASSGRNYPYVANTLARSTCTPGTA